MKYLEKYKIFKESDITSDFDKFSKGEMSFNDFLKNVSKFKPIPYSLDDIKSDIEDILLELDDDGYKTSVYCFDPEKNSVNLGFQTWLQKGGVPAAPLEFVEIRISNIKNFTEVYEIAKRIGYYLSKKTGNFHLDFENTKGSRWIYDRKIFTDNSDIIYYFGFLLKEPMGPFWHHQFAENRNNHK